MQTVLVVDDDDMFRAMMRRHLEGMGFAVIEAPNGRAGFEMIRSRRPALCLLDILMDEQEGFETLAQIKGLDDRPRVIAISSNSLYVSCALDLGADAGIVKPVSLEDLRLAIWQQGLSI
jgi:two-component system, OmpR family, KDP operon response regulator KdpE